jgi:transcriptional regulator with XRE-family HTH domain
VLAVPVREAAAVMTISAEERDFFVAMGERIATLRRANNITQVQLAEALGVSQQTLQSYEVGRRRIPVSAMPVVARTLSVSLDELFGSQAKPPPGKRGPASKLAQQIEVVSQLPRAKQQFVSQMIDTVIAQASAR